MRRRACSRLDDSERGEFVSFASACDALRTLDHQGGVLGRATPAPSSFPRPSASPVSRPARRSLRVAARMVAEPPLAARGTGALQPKSLPPSTALIATGWSDSWRAGLETR